MIITLNVNTALVDDVNEAIALLNLLKGESKPAPKRRASKAKKKEEPKQVEVDKKEDAPAITLDDVRLLMGEKLKSHNAEVKAKFKTYGVRNVTILPAEKYEEFHAFLNDLK